MTRWLSMVRKGGTALRATTSVFAGGTLVSSVLDVGRGVGGELGARLDLRPLSLELRFTATHFLGVDPGNPKPVQSARELGASFVGLRAFDLGPVSLAAGASLGGLHLARTRGTDASLGGPASQLGLVVGAVAQAQRSLWGPSYARLELATLGFIFAPPPGQGLEAAIVWTASLALGAYL